MRRINLLKNTLNTSLDSKLLPEPSKHVVEPAMNHATLLSMLMTEVLRARNASQAALHRLRRDHLTSEEALGELRRTRQEVQLRRQNLLRALASHQGS